MSEINEPHASVQEAPQAAFESADLPMEAWDAILDEIQRDFPKTLARLAE